MNKWTKNLSKDKLSALREDQIRNIQKAIEGLSKRKADFRDPELWQNEINFLEKELAEKRRLWKRGQ